MGPRPILNDIAYDSAKKVAFFTTRPTIIPEKFGVSLELLSSSQKHSEKLQPCSLAKHLFQTLLKFKLFVGHQLPCFFLHVPWAGDEPLHQRKRQKIDRPGGDLAKELSWDVSRGDFHIN